MIKVDKKHNNQILTTETMDLLMKAIQSALINIQVNSADDLRNSLCDIVNGAYDAMLSLPKIRKKDVKYIYNWVNSNLEMFYTATINNILLEKVEDHSEEDDTMRTYILAKSQVLLKTRCAILNDKVNKKIWDTVWFWLKIGGAIIAFIVTTWVALRSTGVVNWPFPTPFHT